MARKSEKMSLDKLPDQIIGLIFVMVIIAVLLGALGSTFYDNWSSVNTTAMGGDANTQTIWDNVPLLFWVIVAAVALIGIYGLLRKQLKHAFS